jgi:hypothetical protein
MAAGVAEAMTVGVGVTVCVKLIAAVQPAILLPVIV